MQYIMEFLEHSMWCCRSSCEAMGMSWRRGSGEGEEEARKGSRMLMSLCDA